VSVARSRAGSLDLFLGFDMASCPPRARRATLERLLREAITAGRLRPGAVLPSSRVLAGELGVSRGMVVDAYGLLVSEGYLATRAGGATTVARRPGAPEPTGPRDVAFPPFDLRPGTADLSAFPWSQWSSAMRSALATTPWVMLDYPPPAGDEGLRSALVDYLARSRGVEARLDQVVTCCGLSHGVAIVTAALRSEGRRRIAIEDPCLPRHRDVVVDQGGEVVPIPVDDQGLRVDAVAAADPDAVLLTPAHQYPTAVTLAPERRRALAAWARQHDRLLVEDDYDAEFRYDRHADGALQALAPDHVVYAGTSSKTLAPGLRLAWMALPERLVGPVVAAKRASGADVSVPDQMAFAELIRSGRYDRHLRRLRTVFRRRRDRLAAALEAGVPHLPVTRPSIGLHLVVGLPGSGPGEKEVRAALAEAGVGVFGLRPCWHGEARWEGLIVGFARPPEPKVDEAIARLVDTLATTTHP
jgi:GntR family transcriptional regulator/MocR family aminotransferase